MTIEKQIAIIPAYEPSEILRKVIEELRENDFKILVVDDGSGKAYQKIFENLPSDVIVLHHNENKGKGRAIKTALLWIQEKKIKDTILVTLDADGQHSVKDAIRICKEAFFRPKALILGSRGFDKNVPLKSKLGNSITRKVFQWLMGITVHDTQTGLRAFSVNLVDFMKDIPGERYEYEMQVLLQCKQHQVPIVEVPIETIYLDGNASSHFHPIRDSFLIYRELLKFASASFISFLLDYACYCIFLLLFGGMTETFRVSMANILARVISGSFNYQLNRKFVFDNQEKVVKTAGQYVVLAIGILILNTGILNGLTWYLGIQENIAKIITELLLFTVSWSVQKFFIFNHTRSPKRNERA